MSPSTSGLGRHPLKVETAVQIRSGMLIDVHCLLLFPPLVAVVTGRSNLSKKVIFNI